MIKLPTSSEPRFIVLLLLVLVAVGLSASLTLGRQEDPTITNIYASVSTAMPGAEPARVEALISTEIESKLREIPEINSITSVSQLGFSVVNVELIQTIEKDHIEDVWVKLRNAVADARINLPASALEPEINTSGTNAYSAVIAISATQPGITPTALKNFAETVETRISNIPNTRRIDTIGAPDEEVLVSVNSTRSAGLGMTLDDIAASIASVNTRASAGRLVTNDIEASLVVSGELSQLQDVKLVPIQDNGKGQVLRVEDIASVTRGASEPSTELALANGSPAILLAALADNGVQIDRWMKFVREELAAASADAPRGMDVSLMFDQSVYTIDRLKGVGKSMLLGMVLVVVVLLITLGWREAAIVALVLPMVSLATIITLSALKLPLHQMSITGLIVSLGLVVDAAIVMTDTVRRNLAARMTRQDAVSSAVQRLFMPLAASTFTTILSFTPMILLPGPTGDFIGSIAISVAIMLFWSFVLAMIMTSALSGQLLATKPAPQQSASHSGLRLLQLIVHYPVVSIALSLVLPILGFVLSSTLTPQFFPAEQRNQFHLEVELPGHSAINKTLRVVEQIDQHLRSTAGIESVYWGIGTSAPSFYYNLIGGRSNEPDFAQAMITTESVEMTNRLLETIQSKLDSAFPQARIIVRRLVQGPAVNAPVEFRIVGPDLNELRRLGEEFQTVMAQQSEITHVRAMLTLGLPQIRFDIDTEKAARIGLDESTIARQLDTGLNGTVATFMVEGTEQIPVRVRLDASLRESTRRIADMPLVLPAGFEGPKTTLLSSIATQRLEASDSVIFRMDGERINVLQGYIRPDVLPEVALRKSLDAIEDSGIVLPPGYRMEIGGDSDERGDAVRSLLSKVGMILTLTLATFVITFRSYRLTAGAVAVAVLAVGLSLLSLAIGNYPFGINALIGIIGSIGVSINAAIIIFTALQHNEQARCGDRDAGAREILGASRHIISTAVTTFGGFLPLVLAGGLFWPPFAVAVAGGVLLSTTIAFLFTPAFFFLFYAPRKPADKNHDTSSTPLPIPPKPGRAPVSILPLAGRAVRSANDTPETPFTQSSVTLSSPVMSHSTHAGQLHQKENLNMANQPKPARSIDEPTGRKKTELPNNAALSLPVTPSQEQKNESATVMIQNQTQHIEKPTNDRLLVSIADRNSVKHSSTQFNTHENNQQSERPPVANKAVDAHARQRLIQEELKTQMLQMLQISSIDPQQSFLELGADSIVLVEAIAMIEARYKIKLKISQLFEEQSTLEALSSYIANSAAEYDSVEANDAVTDSTDQLEKARPVDIASPQASRDDIIDLFDNQLTAISQAIDLQNQEIRRQIVSGHNKG